MMQRCARCVTPDTYPHTTLNEVGVCNFCLDHERTYAGWDGSAAARAAKFERLVAAAKRKRRRYDALVPLSGGKDSTYALYLATKKLGLRTLCCNFANGLQSDVALRNIQSAVEASGADLIMVKPNPKTLMALYRHFFRTVGMFCPVCMRGIFATEHHVARMFDIPLVLKGTSSRTEEVLVPEVFQDGALSFFKGVLREYPFDADLQFYFGDRTLTGKVFRALYLLSNGRLHAGSVDVDLPDYFDWDYHVVYRIIREEMGWTALPDRDEHVDCLADPAVHVMREIRCPDLTANTLRYSAEIRCGNRQRADVLTLVEQEKAEGIKAQHVVDFVAALGISAEEFRTYMTDNRRHMQFQQPGAIVAAIGAIRNALYAHRVH